MKNFEDSFTKFQQESFVEDFFLVKITEKTPNSFEVAFISGTVKIFHNSIWIVE